MTPLFSADSIGKSFAGRVILKSASIWASAGRITVLLGRNGCGKSTLLRIGAGLLRADHGAVHYAGEIYLAPRLHVLARRGLFYLPSNGFLELGLSLRQHLDVLSRRFGPIEAGPVLDDLGITGLLDVPTRALSGGERRRAEVAVAVARAPRCLLADEPFAGISPDTAEVLARVFREMATVGCALVITGHEVPQLMTVADEVVWATAGTTHHIGTPKQAAGHEQFRREYLGPLAKAVASIHSTPQ